MRKTTFTKHTKNKTGDMNNCRFGQVKEEGCWVFGLIELIKVHPHIGFLSWYYNKGVS